MHGSCDALGQTITAMCAVLHTALHAALQHTSIYTTRTSAAGSISWMRCWMERMLRKCRAASYGLRAGGSRGTSRLLHQLLQATIPSASDSPSPFQSICKGWVSAASQPCLTSEQRIGSVQNHACSVVTRRGLALCMRCLLMALPSYPCQMHCTRRQRAPAARLLPGCRQSHTYTHTITPHPTHPSPQASPVDDHHSQRLQRSLLCRIKSHAVPDPLPPQRHHLGPHLLLSLYNLPVPLLPAR